MNINKLELSKFKNIEARDIDTIKNYLNRFQYETCDYNIVNLFSWGHFLNVKWGIYKDRLLFFNFTSEFMLYPLGYPFTSTEMKELSDLIRNEDFPGNFVSVPEGYLALNPAINHNFTPVYDDGNSDYLYKTENLALLGGKKLQKKKNLISQFKRNYSPYKTVQFKEEHIEMCLDLSVKWCMDQNGICDEEKKLELNVLERAVRNHNILGLEGVLLFSNHRLAAFAFYSELKHDIADIHFEKYDPELKGAGQIINLETAICLNDRFTFLNREQDMGKDGLRKAKLSYAPESLIPTYRLIRL
ncbi:TPA: hypothetical protein DCR49_08585 [Candidatus Delongbacteria bacterium]|nr:hypothetical protein [Candidatus Delongbacteria bacterium]